MERALSAEERIRRAEEIYQRRKIQTGVRVPTSNVNKQKNVEYKMFKKLILQIIICLLIYLIFYLIKNSNYIFSENVINKTREFLSYDINLEQLYNQVQEYYNNNIKSVMTNLQSETNEITNEIVNEITNEIENQQVETQIQETTNEEVRNIQVENGIGGGEEGEKLLSNEIVQTSADEENVQEVPLSQMEIDAKDVKENYSIILPLKGTVSSRFGLREATEIVSANHAGIDIAVNEGTVFVAAMEGKVTLLSSESGYGNHLYIEKDDVTTVYAHCKTIYVKEGDWISQGQQIGEVGQTGNATGPHLHFEIRKQNRVINPEYILSFE